jgi:hypothetical protein
MSLEVNSIQLENKRSTRTFIHFANILIFRRCHIVLHGDSQCSVRGQ